MSLSRSHSPSKHRPGSRSGGGAGDAGDRGGEGGGGGGGPLVKIAFGRTQAEAEMLQGLLLEAGIHSVLKRSRGFDNPDFLAAGPHDVFVVSDLAAKARDVLADVMGREGEDPEWTALEEETRLRGNGGGTSPERLAIWIGAVFLGGLILAWILYQLS